MLNLREFFVSIKLNQTHFNELLDENLQELIHNSPDFVYPDVGTIGCNYNSGPDFNPDKCCGCIFGQAFQNMGIDVSFLDGTIKDVLNIYGIQCKKEWSMMQILQDSGVNWGRLKTTIKLINSLED